jgi:hypothetical protein
MERFRLRLWEEDAVVVAGEASGGGTMPLLLPWPWPWPWPPLAGPDPGPIPAAVVVMEFELMRADERSAPVSSRPRWCKCESESDAPPPADEDEDDEVTEESGEMRDSIPFICVWPRTEAVCSLCALWGVRGIDVVYKFVVDSFLFLGRGGRGAILKKQRAGRRVTVWRGKRKTDWRGEQRARKL